MGDRQLAALGQGVAAVGGQLGQLLAKDVAALVRVEQHLELVRERNMQINLTAITDPMEMVWKHAVDSASCLPWLVLPAGSKVIDVGSGAGFPGLVVKCLLPSLQVTLLDAVRKKCAFLEEACRRVGFDPAEGGVKVVWQRAEEAGQVPGLRESFDVVLVRAVARMAVLAELCLPLACVGGIVVAMKGPGVEDEMTGLDMALSSLGGEMAEVRHLELPEGAGQRALVVLRKVRATPRAYPRRPGVPEKSPLGGGDSGGYRPGLRKG